MATPGAPARRLPQNPTEHSLTPLNPYPHSPQSSLEARRSQERGIYDEVSKSSESKPTSLQTGDKPSTAPTRFLLAVERFIVTGEVKVPR